MHALCNCANRNLIWKVNKIKQILLKRHNKQKNKIVNFVQLDMKTREK